MIIFCHDSLTGFNRDVSSHLNYGHRVFHSEQFLKTREPAEQLFYKKVNTDFVSQVMLWSDKKLDVICGIPEVELI